MPANFSFNEQSILADAAGITEIDVAETLLMRLLKSCRTIETDAIVQNVVMYSVAEIKSAPSKISLRSSKRTSIEISPEQNAIDIYLK